MGNVPLVRAELELEVGGTSIRGILLDASGVRRHFSGWLGLLVALEELSSAGGLDPREEGEHAGDAEMGRKKGLLHLRVDEGDRD